jgi:uncharacterized protein
VGRGLEGDLTDLQSNDIINQVTPYYKQNDFNGGITKGVDLIIADLSGTATSSATPSATVNNNDNTIAIVAVFGVIGIFIIVGAISSGGGSDDGSDDDSEDSGSGLGAGILGGVIGESMSKGDSDDSDSESSDDDSDSGETTGGDDDGGSFGGFGGGVASGGGASGSW